MKNVETIKLEQIRPNRSQPRLAFYEKPLQELADSIKENGLLQPIVVRKSGDGYELIAGERRFRAHEMLGYPTIEAIVIDKNDDESADLALIENMQREDLSAIEEARAMQRILENSGLTQAELAKRLGYRQSTVANKLRLLKLSPELQEDIARGVLTERHARALLKVDSDLQEKIAQTIIEKNYTVKETEDYIENLTNYHARKEKGVSNSVRIGINTLKKAYELCRQSGLDASYNETEYAGEVKIVIRFKK